MSVYNKDKESRYLDSVMFKLLDSQGRKYDVSTEGMTALSEMTAMSEKDIDLFLKQVSPSLWVNGAVIFDIPKDAEGLKLEVSGGFGSREKKYIELQ